MKLIPESNSLPPSSQKVWEEYLQTVDEARALMLNSRWVEDPVARAQAQYAIQMLQAFGFNIYMAPRQRYPHFYTHTVFLPFESGFGAPCPDFYYAWTFLDGKKTYRITGKVGTTRWLEFQCQRGFWGDPDQSNLGTWDLDDFKTSPDGSFEIIASPHRHDGNWIELDPAAPNIAMMVREAWYDWVNEQGVELHIECLDRDANEPVALSEAEIERRLRAMGYLTKNSVGFFLNLNQRILDGAGGFNKFWAEDLGETKNVGGNPRAVYPKMIYDIAEGEALIFESEIPNVRFWSVQVADPWFQTIDYAYHQSSLNGHQAHIDSDGSARFVLSVSDPGVPNWIDPVDNKTGVAQWRWYLADRHPIPSVRKVPLSELRQHLPAGTPFVTPEQRRETISVRTRAIKRRFGF